MIRFNKKCFVNKSKIQDLIGIALDIVSGEETNLYGQMVFLDLSSLIVGIYLCVFEMNSKGSAKNEYY